MKLPRENCYTCGQCGYVTVTVDVDYGVTPFMISCKASEKCQGSALSGMYPKAPRPDHFPAPTYEWYKPSKSEMNRLELQSPATWDHAKQGGLLLRKRTDREPVYHKGEYNVEFSRFFDEPSGSSADESRRTGNDLPAES
jgi:hypothetical protein